MYRNRCFVFSFVYEITRESEKCNLLKACTNSASGDRNFIILFPLPSPVLHTCLKAPTMKVTSPSWNCLLLMSHHSSSPYACLASSPILHCCNPHNIVVWILCIISLQTFHRLSLWVKWRSIGHGFLKNSTWEFFRALISVYLYLSCLLLMVLMCPHGNHA